MMSTPSRSTARTAFLGATLCVALATLAGAACSSFDAGDGGAATVDGATGPDGATAPDGATTPDGVAPDGDTPGVACPNPVTFGGNFESMPAGFTPVGDAQITASHLEASDTWASAGEAGRAYIERVFDVSPRAFTATWNLDLVAKAGTYAELGCHVDLLQSPTATYPAILLFFWHSRGDTSMNFQVSKVDATDTESSAYDVPLAVPTTGPHAMSLSFRIAGGTLSGAATFDSATQKFSNIVVDAPIVRVRVLCGLYHAQTDPKGPGSFTMSIDDLVGEICPAP